MNLVTRSRTQSRAESSSRTSDKSLPRELWLVLFRHGTSTLRRADPCHHHEARSSTTALEAYLLVDAPHGRPHRHDTTLGGPLGWEGLVQTPKDEARRSAADDGGETRLGFACADSVHWNPPPRGDAATGPGLEAGLNLLRGDGDSFPDPVLASTEIIRGSRRAATLCREAVHGRDDPTEAKGGRVGIPQRCCGAGR